MNSTTTLLSDPLTTTIIENKSEVKKDPFGWYYSMVPTGVYQGVVIHGKQLSDENSSSLHFPDYIDGTPVVGIAQRAFVNGHFIREITNWPYALKFIGAQAFAGCHKLSSYLSLPSSLKYIEKEAFADCSQLKAVELPFYLKQIGLNSFRGCSQLKYMIYTSMHPVQVMKDSSRINRPFEFPLQVGNRTILMVPYDIYSEMNRLCNEFFFYEIRAMSGR